MDVPYKSWNVRRSIATIQYLSGSSPQHAITVVRVIWFIFEVKIKEKGSVWGSNKVKRYYVFGMELDLGESPLAALYSLLCMTTHIGESGGALHWCLAYWSLSTMSWENWSSGNTQEVWITIIIKLDTQPPQAN